MTAGAKQVRLNLLLNHLRKGRWRKLPRQVGLKTALVAAELGLVESKGDDLRARAYRLTTAGNAYLRTRFSLSGWFIVAQSAPTPR